MSRQTTDGKPAAAAENDGNGNSEGKRKLISRWLHWILSLFVLGGLALAVLKYVNGPEVIKILKEFSWVLWLVVLGLSLAEQLCKALWFGIAFKELCGARRTTIIRAYFAGQPATLVPGGIAARIGLLAEAGCPAATAAAPVLVNSIFDQLTFVLLALITALWFEAARFPAFLTLAVMATIALLLALPLTRGWIVGLVRIVLRRFGALKHWDAFLSSLHSVARPKILISGMLLTIVAKLLTAVILDVCLRGLGVATNYPLLVLAVVLPTMIGRLTPMPAGVGPTEVGMVMLLQQDPSISLSTATAATTLYRLITILFQALVGAVIYFFFWHGRRERISGQGNQPVLEPGHQKATH